MTDRATRYLYLARHGEATADESGLTETGRRQAALLGERLRAAPLSAVHHGPLPRAAETARLVRDRLAPDRSGAEVPLRVSEAAGDRRCPVDQGRLGRGVWCGRSQGAGMPS